MGEPMSKSERDAGKRAAVPPGMPRWVKVSGLALLVVAAVLVVLMLLAGGEHGPGLHTDAGDPTSGVRLSVVRGVRAL